MAIVPTVRCREVGRSVAFHARVLAITVEVDEVDALFETFRSRGLDPSTHGESPVHQGPLEQSWGTGEFYVDDPDGNTLRFVCR